MSNTIVQTELLAISILAKGIHRNSVLLGSKHKIAKKLNISYHTLRKCFNYGIANHLIIKFKGGFIVPSYKRLIAMYGYTPDQCKKFTIRKKGTFEELYLSNLFSIAEMNFKQQQFRSKFNEKILNIREKTRTEKMSISKVEYKLFCKTLSMRVWLNKNIITGQYHLANILKVSSSYCNKLLKIWSDMKLIHRELLFSKDFDKFEDSHRILRLKKGNFICKGSIITLIPSPLSI